LEICKEKDSNQALGEVQEKVVSQGFMSFSGRSRRDGGGERRGLQVQPHLKGTHILLSLLPQLWVTPWPAVTCQVGPAGGALGFGWLHGGKETVVSAGVGMWDGCPGVQEWLQHKECSQGGSLRGPAEELVSNSM